MAISPDAVKAYEELETALKNLLKHDPQEFMQDDTVITGWQLIIGGINFTSSDPKDDDLDVENPVFFYCRRGQSPLLSRGLVEAYIDEFRGTNNG